MNIKDYIPQSIRHLGTNIKYLAAATALFALLSNKPVTTSHNTTPTNPKDTKPETEEVKTDTPIDDGWVASIVPTWDAGHTSE